jgi:hypothetical protein
MRTHRRKVWRTCTGVLVATVAACVIGAPFIAKAVDTEGRAHGIGAWEQIRSVLQHPRCLNCHQVDVPLQGDERRLHVPLVHRGKDNLGDVGMRCTNCHNKSGNNDTSRTPGAPPWSLAPLSMLWQGLSDGDLCRMLKDPARNGHRDGAKLLEHMESEPLVLWAWNPGAGRTTPPIGHDQFVGQMKIWIDAGTPCPE